ncbi:MAG: hypothetical protein FJX71_02695 [Alphaproteobacteria bacterium]|nr:hypothetical protein [Alphaproteobacteria bacterium]
MTRKRRELSDEEQSLWNLVARKIRPLLKHKKPASPPNPNREHKPPIRAKKLKHPISSILLSEPSEGYSKKSSKGHLTRRTSHTKKISFQDRLDLHGLTLKEAQIHLKSFLIACQRHGYLWVLVITGKGRHQRKSESAHTHHSLKTLQNCVPEWLDDPRYAPLVAAYGTAKPQDGGSGALYVRLKKRAIKKSIRD